MLYRLVRPVQRSGSSVPQFVQRIPADVKARAAGLKLAIPLGRETLPLTISSRAASVRFSLRTRDPGEAKVRQASAAGYLETVWQALRQDRPASITPRQAHALAGELYRSWADEGRDRTIALENVAGAGWQRVPEGPAERRATGDAVAERWAASEHHGAAEGLGPLVECRHGLRWNAGQSRRRAFPVTLPAQSTAIQAWRRSHR